MTPTRGRKTTLRWGTALTVVAAVALGGTLLSRPDENAEQTSAPSTAVLKKAERREKAKTNAIERAQFMFHLLRDPATNSVPEGIRARELNFARAQAVLSRGGGSSYASWTGAGPVDVGGRVRALEVDINDGNTILTGAASGGIWKSTDKGATWGPTTTPDHPISALAQDPTSPTTWYYGSGELGNSAGDRGGTATYYGSGLYKSTDNGDSWVQLHDSGDPHIFDSLFEFVTDLKVSPVTGTVFMSSFAYGVSRSTDGGNSFSLTLGAANEHRFADVDVASDGTVVAVVSDGFISSSNPPGVYKSTDDGATWINITPATFPTDGNRSEIAVAPSNSDVAYLLTTVSSNDLRLHRITVSSGASVERTANLPNFGPPVGELNSQGDYNLTIAVKPDDEDFILLGWTNLFRSADGAATPMNNADANWIGGYYKSNDVSQWPNHHADNHAIAFDPVDPNGVWSGHDSGVSFVDDVRAATIDWQAKDIGLNITQFYDISIHPDAADDRIAGGAQDNGTPYWRIPGGTPTTSRDISSGDGSHCYLGSTRAYTSVQNANLRQLYYDGSGEPQWDYFISPPAGGQFLFIHPFAVDPQDESILLLPNGDYICRLVDPGTSSWLEMPGVSAGASHKVTALAMSETGHRLYFAGYNENLVPTVFRLDDAHTATDGEVDISIPGAAPGSYPHNIAVNPANMDEAIVVMSNYNITGVFHTTDAGATWAAVEGDLIGDGSNPGPSIRDALITELPSEETLYLVATSTGLYATTTLNGSSTQWQPEGSDAFGNAVVEAVSGRVSDQTIVVGTHGLGAYVGDAGTTSSVSDPASATVQVSAAPNPFRDMTSLSFNLQESGPVQVSVFDAAGRKVRSLANGEMGAAHHSIDWDGRDDSGQSLAAGVYLYQVRSVAGSTAGRVILTK